MLDRLIDRLPAVLLLGVILLAVQVAVFEVDKPAQVIGAIPSAALLFLYLRAGSGGGGKGGGKRQGLMDPVHVTSHGWQLAVGIGTFLAGVHAFRKVSPYFAIAWFGSGLVFGWFWTEHHGAPEAMLLPALLIYIAAAVSKGIVERGNFTGNHVVHVIATGLFTGLIALPVETAAGAMGWITPRGAPAVTHGHVKPEWLGGGSADLAVQWAVLGLIFYAVYKILDHIGLGSVLQTVLLFGVMPFLPKLVEAALGLLG